MDGIQVAVENLRAFRDAAPRAGASAAEAMARHGQQVDREVLTLRQHAPHTRTPSPPGAPPAMIGGALAADMGHSEAFPLGAGTWEAHAGPTGRVSRSRWGPTGRFLEYGGTHVAHSPRGMRWLEDGRWHTAHEITKGSRDYLEYAMRVMIADGSLHDVAVEGFLEAEG